MHSVLLLLLVSYVVAQPSDFCSTDDDDLYNYMATKTAYNYVRGDDAEIQSIPNCQPLQIWMLARHGTRYPTQHEIRKLKNIPLIKDQIIYNHEIKNAGKLCKKQLENLKKWTLNITADMDSQLVEQGREDNKLLAKRLKLKFPRIFKSMNHTSKNYIFRSTNRSRTIDSMDAFTEGLFENKFDVETVVPTGEDTLLKPYSYCPRWNEAIGTDPIYFTEYKKFINSKEFINTINNVNERLGYQSNLPSSKLSIDPLLAMYNLCRYEKSWMLDKISPWCGVFSKDDLKVLEFYNDLEYYYKFNHDKKINDLIGCFPLQDMFNNFRSLEENDNNEKPKGIFYFTHSKLILSFLSTIDVTPNQKPLTADHYKEHLNREWNTSMLSPFNSNIIAVFFRCKKQESPNKVMFYLQEKPLLYEGCQNGLCDWEYLKEKFSAVANECSIDACHIEKNH